jgi:hypothetical protein
MASRRNRCIKGSCVWLELGLWLQRERENVAALYDGEMSRGRRVVLWVEREKALLCCMMEN